MYEQIDIMSLITSEHNDRPKFRNWLNLNALYFNDLGEMAIDMMDKAFDIDIATSVQLDILGDIIGRKRRLTFQPSGGISSHMDDNTYRLVLKAKIAQNMWDGTIGQLVEIWNTIFPDKKMAFKDNQDMTMDVVIFDMTSTLQNELIQNGYIIPKPMGVKVNYGFTSEVLFSYDVQNAMFAGYDTGTWLKQL